MERIRKKRAAWTFIGLVAAQCLAPLVSMALFSRRFDYPARFVGYHVIVAGMAYLVVFAGAAGLASLHVIRGWKAARYVLPLGWALVSITLYYLYLLAWVGRLLGGADMTYGMVAPYIWRPTLVLQLFSVSPIVYWTGLAVVPALMLLGYFVMAQASSATLLRLRVHLAANAKSRRFAAAGLGAVVVTTLVFLWLAPPPKPVGRLFGDPILSWLTDKGGVMPIAGSSMRSDAAARSYPSPDQPRKKNVIIILLDACRADHLGVNGYARDTTPFLDSLKATGNLRMVRSFCSSSCCTFGGVLSLLRSQNWFDMTPRAFALQDVLKRVGYQVRFITSGDLSDFQNIAKYYGHSIDSFTDGASPSRHYSLNDDRGVFESFNDVPAYQGTPAFLYFHLMSVHALRVRLSSFIKYKPAANPRISLDYFNNHDNGILQADSAIQELFRRLAAKGYLQDSIVIITGDHGDSLGERGVRGHTHNLYYEEVTPPLLIYDADPAVKYRNLEVARQIDIAPTILDRLGLPIPSSWDGQSLLTDGPPRDTYLRYADLYAVIDRTPERTVKYIYDDLRKKEEIYDLDSDPKENHDVFQETSLNELKRLRALIARFDVHPGT